VRPSTMPRRMAVSVSDMVCEVAAAWPQSKANLM
jgi:hypothetical protein